MIVLVEQPAEWDLQAAFDYYEAAEPNLGHRFLNAFRRAVDLIIQFPHGWQMLDRTYRRCRLRRFPYGIIYRVDESSATIVIVAVADLRRRPDSWRHDPRK